MITDCHIHIEPLELYKLHALELLKHKRANFDEGARPSTSLLFAGGLRAG